MMELEPNNNKKRSRGKMLTSPNREDLQKIVVLNPKGGCGKTTLATNLASYFALNGPMPALLDCDPLGFSMRWLEKRSPNRPPIYGIAAYKNSPQATRSWQLRVPSETTRLIVDTPAALNSPQIHDLIYDANNILIPVLPSPIDIRFAAQFIAELLLVTQIERGNRKLAIIANRTRSNTRALKQLMRFLTSLQIPIIAIIRDSQNYVQASDTGIGVYEMPHHKAHRDIDDLSAVVTWLEQWKPTHQETAMLTPSDSQRVHVLQTQSPT
jgi:chromosome partitioning protein